MSAPIASQVNQAAVMLFGQLIEVLFQIEI
jgi:hypothetical protein